MQSSPTNWRRLGGHHWRDEHTAVAEPVGDGAATGWRTRVRLDTSGQGRAGFHRYHSSELITELNCAQFPDGMLDGLNDWSWPPGAHLHVAVDDDGARHVVQSGPRTGSETSTLVVEGRYEAMQRIGARIWRVPVTAFWQAHRDAARDYSELVAGWAQLDRHDGVGFIRRGRDFRRRAGRRLLGSGQGRHRGHVTRCLAVGPCGAGRPRLGVGGHRLGAPGAGGAVRERADVAVLDPPRSGAGREVIDLLAAAEVPRMIHIGCEAASFARDVGLYLGHGYVVEDLRVFDSFPLTHHVECVAVLTR